MRGDIAGLRVASEQAMRECRWTIRRPTVSLLMCPGVSAPCDSHELPARQKKAGYVQAGQIFGCGEGTGVDNVRRGLIWRRQGLGGAARTPGAAAAHDAAAGADAGHRILAVLRLPGAPGCAALQHAPVGQPCVPYVLLRRWPTCGSLEDHGACAPSKYQLAAVVWLPSWRCVIVSVIDLGAALLVPVS